MTGRDLVSASLRLIGVLAPGETLPAAEAADALATVNRMIDSWSNESLLIHAKVREVFSLVGGTQSYTIGTGGTFNTDRPLRVDAASIKVGSTEYPLNQLGIAEWAAISDKTSTSDIPTDMYLSGSYPLETISLYPTPSAANSIVLYSWKPLDQISTLDTDVSLPPGYEEALIYNAAIRLSPEYGRTVTAEVAMLAAEAKASIKRMNHKPRLLRADPAFTAAGFNFTTGGSE